MKYVLSREQMQAVDKKTIEEFGLPSRLLMENAGKACADWFENRYEDIMDKQIVFFCGTGNNGGDGLVMARYLRETLADIIIVLVGDDKRSEDNRINLELCEKLEMDVLTVETPDDFEDIRNHISGATYYVDAIFGTGFRGELDELHSKIVKFINYTDATVISIDIPSGLDANHGISQIAVQASHTLVIQCPVYGNLIGFSASYCGTLHYLPIGIPDLLIDEADPIIWLEQENLALPIRFPQSNKGDYGRVAIIAGSPGLSGAATLASKAAIRAGAGYVMLYSHPELKGLYETVCPELLSRAFDPENDTLALSELDRFLKDADSVLVGPGLGLSPRTSLIVEHVLKNTELPIIFDGDALTTLAAKPALKNLFAERDVLLTPHWGEFTRLANVGLDKLYLDPIGILRQYCKKNHVSVILKSHYCLIADDAEIFLVKEGNDSLSKAGSGDVLAGIIASFIAQRMEPMEAAINASILLGKTAVDLCAVRDKRTVLPSDIIDNLMVSAPKAGK